MGMRKQEYMIPCEKGTGGVDGMYRSCPEELVMEPEGKLEIWVHNYSASYSNDDLSNTSFDPHVSNKNMSDGIESANAIDSETTSRLGYTLQ